LALFERGFYLLRMRIVVLGASGGVGQWFVRFAHAAGHTVRAIARTGSPVDAERGVEVVRADVLQGGAIVAALERMDVVCSCLGIRRAHPRNPWSQPTSPADFTSSTAREIVRASKLHDVKRIVAISAAGVAESAPAMNFVMKFLVARSSIGIAYRDLARMEQVYREGGVPWMAPRPVTLTNGRRTDRVREVASFGLTATISRADVAGYLLACVEGRAVSSSPTPLIAGP
jgi:uncharacterized protein YbjT (DUF2867 family)